MSKLKVTALVDRKMGSIKEAKNNNFGIPKHST
jgi:hypothetical protein